jgi:hypothetical protein
LGLLLAGLLISGCGARSTPGGAAAANGAAARVETIEGTSTVRIVLSATAARRLGIETARVTRVSGARGSPARTAIPYAAVLYGPDGNTLTFTSPSPLAFVPRPIDVDHVTDGVAVLRGGPPVGTEVVTVGSTELLGVEFGVQEG